MKSYSALTNKLFCALVSKVNLTQPVTNTRLYGESIARIANVLGAGKPIIQTLKDLKINLDDNLFIPHISTINELRRNAINEYTKLLTDKYKRNKVENLSFEYDKDNEGKEDSYRKILKRAGFVTRDPRVKERKKPGLKGARRAPQFSKR